MTSTIKGDEAEIRLLVDQWAAAVRAYDVPGIVKDHAQDILMFDLPGPTQARGWAFARLPGDGRSFTSTIRFQTNSNRQRYTVAGGSSGASYAGGAVLRISPGSTVLRIV